MTPAWAQRRDALLSDCLVSPAIFHQMLDRLGAFVVPYQRALASEAAHHPMQLYLQGLLSQLPRKNAEAIAAWVDVERQVMQDFIGTVPWDHRPLVAVLVGQVATRLGEPDGILAFDPSSFPKRGRHSVGVKRQWCSHRGKVDTCQVGVFMGYVSRVTTMPYSTSACPCPKTGHGTSNDARNATCRWRYALRRARSSVWRCSTRGGTRYRTAGSPAMMNWVATCGFATSCASAVSAMCWGSPAIPSYGTSRPHSPRMPDVAVPPRRRGTR